MTERELRAVEPFATLPIGTDGVADRLRRPDGPEYNPGVIYEASDVAQVRDFLHDPELAPKGGIRDDSGHVRAIFWQLRRGPLRLT